MWAIEYFDPVLQTPGGWLAVNMGSWLLLAILLLKVMKQISLRHNGDVSVNLTLNAPIDMDAWAMYLTERSVQSEHGDTNLSTQVSVKRYCWVERSGRQWEGRPPAIEVEVDEQHAFILRATLTANRHKSRLGTAQLQAVFVESLHSEGVLR